MFFQCFRTRRFEYAVRTTYTTAVTLIMVNYINWGGQLDSEFNLTYISALLAPVSATITFGAWCLSAYSVLYSSVIGGLLGISVGLSYKTKSAHFILLFIALVMVNRW